jgi:CHAT domain-containing protein
MFYAHTSNLLRCWFIDRTGLLAFHEQELTPSAVTVAVDRLRAAIGVRELQATRAPRRRDLRCECLPSIETNIETESTSLTSLVFPGEVADVMAQVRHLVVVPTLSLGTIPFGMLRLPGDHQMVIDRMSVSIAPSLFDLDQELREEWPKNYNGRYTFESPLVIGITDFPEYDELVLPPLPGAGREAAVVSNLLGTTALLGPSATKRAIASRSDQANLVYFATHAYADDQDGFLCIWPDDEEDGRWTGQEIHDTKFPNAYIAILSACQTGLGAILDGGVNGVARSFQLGGVSRVIVSLWSVRDEETVEFMQKLIDKLHTNMAAEALRLTMLEMRERHPDPIVWAPFILFGTPR